MGFLRKTLRKNRNSEPVISEPDIEEMRIPAQEPDFESMDSSRFSCSTTVSPFLELGQVYVPQYLRFIPVSYLTPDNDVQLRFVRCEYCGVRHGEDSYCPQCGAPRR